jgi:hypothetical protein
MDRITNAVIDRLSTGDIKKIVLYSDTSVYPAPPYIVVKPEPGAMPGTRLFRIIVHAEEGNADFLEDYTLVKLDSMLNGTIIDKEGAAYKLRAEGYTDILPDIGDNTYFMERVYYTPLTVRR